MAHRLRLLTVSLAALVLTTGAASGAGPEPIARQSSTATAIDWESLAENAGMHLRVILPDGSAFERDFAAGTNPEFDLARDGHNLEGTYNFELMAVATPVAGGRSAAASEARRPTASAMLSGTFRVQNGVLYAGQGSEEPLRRPAATASPGLLRPITAPDQVIADDLVVQGSACFGLDCVNNESFGFDTIRMKENNTRIKFDDTSTSAGFPNHDWQLTANDSASGGANKLSIEDITAATVPFTVSGSAPTNSMFIDSSGRVGLHTSTPVLDLHISTGNTPAFRLQQTATGGYTAQTWDIAGNEANFFVRDVTGGSRLPLRIRPGAPTSSIDISASGNVGAGTSAPPTSLHVQRSDGTAKLLIEETSATAMQREIAEFRNDGGVTVIYKDSTVAERWNIGTNGHNVIMNNQSNGGIEFTLGNTGNLTIAGTLTQNSDVHTKDQITAVDPATVLTRLASLPISTWHYRTDSEGVRHLGPMAQDFAASFGLGDDDRHIAPLDAAGVSLAAIQGLQREIAVRDARIRALEERGADLERRLGELEGRLRAIRP